MIHFEHQTLLNKNYLENVIPAVSIVHIFTQLSSSTDIK